MRRLHWTVVAGLAALGVMSCIDGARGVTTHVVQATGFEFQPSSLVVQAGDKVRFEWVNGFHTATSGSLCKANGAFNFPLDPGNPKGTYTVSAGFEGVIPYFCATHCQFDMTGEIHVRRRGDINLDGVVGAADLGMLLGSWGPCTGCAADFNDDGIVNAADLAVLLGSWG